MKPVVEFWSSTEGAAFQQAQVRALGAAGWPAELKYEVAQFDYWTARSRFERLRLRFRAYALYPVRLALRFRSRRADGMAVVCTNTFYAPWVVLKIRRPGLSVVHWVFDLFPEVLVAAGKLKAGGLVERRLHRLVRATFDGAAANVFLGAHLLRHAERTFGPIPRTHVIPVGADGAPFRDQPPQPRPAGAPIRILYCGNLGRMHDTETVVAAVQAGLPASIVLAFRGNGPGFPVLRESLKGTPQVEIGPNLPEAEWVSAMRETDGALVTMRRGAEGLVMPSKTYSAMVAGQAILAVCPLNSDLADLVLKHDAGWVIVPGDASGLTQLIQRIAESPEEVFAKRCNAWRAGHEFYDQRVLAKDWVRVLEELRAQSAG